MTLSQEGKIMLNVHSVQQVTVIKQNLLNTNVSVKEAIKHFWKKKRNF